MATYPQTNGAASWDHVCNPDTAVTIPMPDRTIDLSDVLAAIDSLRLRHGQCFAAFRSHPRPDCRESARNSSAVFAALGQLRDEVERINASTLFLSWWAMGDEIREMHETARRERLAAQFRCGEPSESFRADENFQAFHAHSAVEDATASLIGSFRLLDSAGSAEEQPAPREESRPPIGETPCDGGRGESIPPLPPAKVQAYAETNGLPPRPFKGLEDWLDSASTAEVEATLDVILLEMHCRGRDLRIDPHKLAIR